MNEMQSTLEIMIKKFEKLEMKTKIQESEIRILRLENKQTNKKLVESERKISEMEKTIKANDTEIYHLINSTDDNFIDMVDGFEKVNQKLAKVEKDISEMDDFVWENRSRISDIETDAYMHIAENSRRIDELRGLRRPGAEDEFEDDEETDSGYESTEE